MTEPDTTENRRRPAASRGRPQDDERTTAILDAATEILMETGYDKLRIQDVADRACSGTGAIYRRWKTKEDLVAEAIRTMDEPEADVSDDPVADLRNLIEGKAMEYYGDPDMLPGMIAAMRTHPVIADAVHERYNVDFYRNVLARIMGEDNPFLDTLAELTPALALHRISFQSGVDGPGLADEVIALAEALSDSST
ncbi:MAG: helix-turn-helix domain-containing protein [Actinomycetota bacterium]